MPFVTSKNPQIPVPPTPSFRKVHELSLKSGLLMATPPQGPKNDVGEALSGPSRSLLRLAKVTQKRGFSRQFTDGFPAVCRQFCQWSPGGFPAVLPAVRRPLSSRFASGLPAVFQRFDARFPTILPTVFQRFDNGFPAVFQRFAGNTLPLDQPPAGSGPPFEKRESGNYSDTLINAILSRAQGKTLAIPAATAALEMCAGVVGRSRR